MYTAECDECGREFYNWNPWHSVQQHKEAVHYQYNDDGDYDEDEEWDTDNDESETEEEENSPYCGYCNRDFDSYHSLSQHNKVSTIHIHFKHLTSCCL